MKRIILSGHGNKGRGVAGKVRGRSRGGLPKGGGNTHQAKSSARSSEQALRGIGTFLASIHGTAFHTETHDVKEFLLCERPIHRQDDARRDLLHKMTSLDQTAVRIAPTPSNGQPMLHYHGHHFRVDLTV